MCCDSLVVSACAWLRCHCICFRVREGVHCMSVLLTALFGAQGCPEVIFHSIISVSLPTDMGCIFCISGCVRQIS